MCHDLQANRESQRNPKGRMNPEIPRYTTESNFNLTWPRGVNSAHFITSTPLPLPQTHAHTHTETNIHTSNYRKAQGDFKL